MLTGQKDVDIKILSELNVKDLTDFCKTNNYIKNICKQDEFWKRLTLYKFKDICKKENQTWKEYYIYRLTHIIFTLDSDGFKVEVSVEKNGKYMKNYIETLKKIAIIDGIVPEELNTERIGKLSAGEPTFFMTNFFDPENFIRDAIEAGDGYDIFLNGEEGEKEYDRYLKLLKDDHITEMK